MTHRELTWVNWWKNSSWLMLALVLGSSLGLGCRKGNVGAPAEGRAPVPVHVAVVVMTSGWRELCVDGTLEARRSVPVGFLVGGTVSEVPVEEGQAVVRGQTLARLDDASLRDAAAMARAKSEQAEDAWRRMEPLYRGGSLSEIRFVEVETARTEARLALSIAEKNLSDAVLHALEAGWVARRHLEPGALAVPGLPVVTMLDTRVLKARAGVAERDVASLQAGDPAQVEVPALHQILAGRIARVGVAADPLTRTYGVEVELANPGNRLKAGMQARLRLRVPAPAGAVAVPPQAVRVRESGAPVAFVVDGQCRLRRRDLIVDGFSGELLVVSHGLAAGDRVVVSGTPMLEEGQTVTIAGEQH